MRSLDPGSLMLEACLGIIVFGGLLVGILALILKVIKAFRTPYTSGSINQGSLSNTGANSSSVSNPTRTSYIHQDQDQDIDEQSWESNEMAKAMADDRWQQQRDREAADRERRNEQEQRDREIRESAQDDRDRKQQAEDDYAREQNEKWDAVYEEREERLWEKYYGEDEE